MWNSFHNSRTLRGKRDAAKNDAREAAERRFGYIGSRSPVHRGRATTHRAKLQDSAGGGPVTHIKALDARARPRKRSPAAQRIRENSCGSRTQKKRPKPRSNHGFDHVDDRPRARADGGAQTIAPLVARKAAPPVPFSREKAPISVRPLHKREARLRR